ncbi:energy transducer TonB [Pontibacter ruber]|uniref:Energy transducer TonB n=1 Tax=Pontibacter ruber TaxID=1343895 RepID=A0ABW5D3D4_9BACT|nr:energy transducer TonB [Pontibacter ruber]
MKESYLLDMTFNNIVFKGRNKAYGAYALRRTYSRHVIMAAIIATALFSGALVWSLLQHLTTETPTVPKDEKVIEILYPLDIPLPPPPSTEKAKPAPLVKKEKPQATVKDVQQKVVADNAVVKEETRPTQEELSKAVASTQTTEGTAATNSIQTTDTVGEADGTKDAETAAAPATVYNFVADMPQYEGGEKGLAKYLSKNLRYPADAMRAGVEGIVVVSFVVNSNGEVTEAAVVKSLGYGTDEEAIRVIQKMPRWTPGKQNGKPVAVRFTMPIRFSMQR